MKNLLKKIFIILFSVALFTNYVKPSRRNRIKYLRQFTQQNIIETKLFNKAKEGSVNDIQKIINIHTTSGIDIDYATSLTNNFGQTLLHVTAFNGNFDVAMFLIGNGANVSAIDKRSSTVLHIAIGNWDKGRNRDLIIYLLHNYPSLLTIQTTNDEHCRNPLHLFLRFAPGEEFVFKNIPAFPANIFTSLLETIFQAIKQLNLEQINLIFSQESFYGTADKIITRFYSYSKTVSNAYKKHIQLLKETLELLTRERFELERLKLERLELERLELEKLKLERLELERLRRNEEIERLEQLIRNEEIEKLRRNEEIERQEQLIRNEELEKLRRIEEIEKQEILELEKLELEKLELESLRINEEIERQEQLIRNNEIERQKILEIERQKQLRRNDEIERQKRQEILKIEMFDREIYIRNLKIIIPKRRAKLEEALYQTRVPSRQITPEINQLYTAIEKGNIYKVTYLIQENPNIQKNLNIQNSEGNTPLHIAVSLRLTSIAKLLIENEANPNIQNYKGNTPLHIAIDCRFLELAKLLIEKEANPNIRNLTGTTAFHLAVKNKLIGITRSLVDYTSYITQDSDFNTPLHIAIDCGFTELAQLLIKKRIAFHKLQNLAGKTIFHLAVKNELIDITRSLIAYSYPSLNTKDFDGNTPLHIAIDCGFTELAQLLIEKGADLNISNNSGKSFLYLATKKKNYRIVICLVEKGASFYCKEEATNFINMTESPIKSYLFNQNKMFSLVHIDREPREPICRNSVNRFISPLRSLNRFISPPRSLNRFISPPRSLNRFTGC